MNHIEALTVKLVHDASPNMKRDMEARRVKDEKASLNEYLNPIYTITDAGLRAIGRLE